ncbi:hypothetical protein [Allosalinactinospora lopnorensis]|uniref:hypothetical protein n=1 Tax=Allosalinactinospora lopnorensis TaxID=1352348 RepID=UPI000623D262|nr:hypothetical protein [Allosalinactinospora lopnorensis]
MSAETLNLLRRLAVAGSAAVLIALPLAACDNETGGEEVQTEEDAETNDDSMDEMEDDGSMDGMEEGDESMEDGEEETEGDG